MYSQRANFLVKFTALLAVLAWFVATNHCALSAMLDGLRKADSDAKVCHRCPGHDESGGTQDCCKGIKVTTSTKGLPDFAAADSGTLIAILEIATPAALSGRARVALAGTGPPRSISFAEAVLSRSHQSHAPPVFG